MTFFTKDLITNRNLKDNRAFLHYDAFAIICRDLITQRDSETWQRCVEAGGSLEIAALKSVSFSDFEDFVFNVQNRSQEIALKLFNVLHTWYNQRDGGRTLEIQFCSAAGRWLILSVKFKFRQLSKAIVQIRGMERLSFREAMINAAVVDWGDFFCQWLEREKTLFHNDIERYQFAQYLGRSLRNKPSLDFSYIKTLLIEIWTNSAPLLRGCRRSDVNGIIRQIRETMAEGENTSIMGLVRALEDNLRAGLEKHRRGQKASVNPGGSSFLDSISDPYQLLSIDRLLNA